MGGISKEEVIEHFDFEKLTSSDEVTSDLDVGLGRSRLTVWDDYAR